MRRALVIPTTVVLMLAALAPAVSAQTEEHPIVGAWVKDPLPDDPTNQPDLLVIEADGTFIDVAVPETGIGTWEPTEDGGFVGTSMYPLVDEQAGFLGLITARIAGQVSEDGQTVSGTYTIEFPTEPAGAFPAGEFGPAEWVATRVAVEPQGETVGPWPLPPTPAE